VGGSPTANHPQTPSLIANREAGRIQKRLLILPGDV